MNPEIEKTLKSYLQAFHSQDFDTMFGMLYEEDVNQYHQTFLSFAEKMDVFGETEDFLKKIRVKDLETLKQMSTRDFLISIFKLVTREVGKKELKKMLEGTRILKIDDAHYMTIVTYQIPYEMFGEWSAIESQLSMILSEGKWKIFFKSGLDQALQVFQDEIDLYEARKTKDKPDNFTHEGNLTKYNLVGYKNLNGEVVFEARFKDAGDFSHGLAYVKIMRKYGYINLKGDIAIKPQFWDARDFSEKRAAVKATTESGKQRWGFISQKGAMVIEPQYDEVSAFSEGLCAVRKKEKWGYINHMGKTVIPHQFVMADDFEDGTAEVTLEKENGEYLQLVLDQEGGVL